jgi:hypothetical protein
MKAGGEWGKHDFIPFEMLRKQWQTVVLKLIRKGLKGKEREREEEGPTLVAESVCSQWEGLLCVCT